MTFGLLHISLTGPSPLVGARFVSDFCIVTLGLTNIRCVTLGIDNDLYRNLWPEKKDVEKVAYSLTRESPVTRDFARVRPDGSEVA